MNQEDIAGVRQTQSSDREDRAAVQSEEHAVLIALGFPVPELGSLPEPAPEPVPAPETAPEPVPEPETAPAPKLGVFPDSKSAPGSKLTMVLKSLPASVRHTRGRTGLKARLARQTRSRLAELPADERGAVTAEYALVIMATVN